MKCPICGANVPPGASTCKYCGASIILPKHVEEKMRKEQERERYLKTKIKELIGSRYFIAEIYDAIKDRAILLESARKLPNVVSVEFVAPNDTLRILLSRGKSLN